MFKTNSYLHYYAYICQRENHFPYFTAIFTSEISFNKTTNWDRTLRKESGSLNIKRMRNLVCPRILTSVKTCVKVKVTRSYD